MRSHLAFHRSKRVYQFACHAILAAALIIALGACSKRYDDLPAFSPFEIKDYPNHSVGRFKTTYLADQIDGFYRGTDPGPIGITTFVKVDDLYSTSTFGRILSEQLMSELAFRGYDVIELRQSGAIQFRPTMGEFGLSRDIAEIKRERTLGGIVVGTYIASPERVYVNARLLDPTTSMVLSAGSVEMEKTGEIARLLRGGGVAPVLERIPVKHLGQSRYPLYMFKEENFSEGSNESFVAPALPPVRKK